jgi:hypothetical protein
MPPARMTAASSDPFTDPFRAMAGAPGFEPGIAGPKPAALPLGYAPEKWCRPHEILPAAAEQHDEGDDGQDRHCDDGDRGDDEEQKRHEGDERLRDCRDPGDVTDQR